MPRTYSMFQTVNPVDVANLIEFIIIVIYQANARIRGLKNDRL